MADKLTKLFHCMLKKESIPKKELKDAPIIHLYKRKGNPQSVTTAEASLSYQLLERYRQNYIESPECASSSG